MFLELEEFILQLAPFVATPPDVALQMLIQAELKPGEIVYDLGSGDGRVVIMAAQEFGAAAVGIELSKYLVKRALQKVSDLHLENRVKIVNDDLFRIDTSSADVVTLYLTTSANKKVRPKLEDELEPGTRIVSHNYEMPGWKPYKIIKVQTFQHQPHTIYVYRRG